MATAKESHTCQQFTARDSSYLDRMAQPHLDKNTSVPCFPPYKCTATAAYPGQHASDLPSVHMGQQDAVGGFSKPLSPYCNTSYPTGDLYLRDSQCVLSRGIGDKPVGASFAPQRRFLIFDRSENHTRLFLSPFSPRDQILTSAAPASAMGSLGKVATQVHQVKPVVEEEWDENHLCDEEGEMLEDTEEINALLYSDSDDDYDDDNGESDEVSSTGHSPPFTTLYDRDKSVDEVAEEVAEDCDEAPPKRQRLDDGKYKKSSLGSGTRAMTNRCSYEDDVEWSCGGDDGGIGIKKGKIRQALKLLESMIPGLDKRDPVSIIDGAVEYLKSMKTEAESLGLSPPASHVE